MIEDQGYYESCREDEKAQRAEPTQRAGADVPVYYITGHDWDFEEDPSPDERSWVRYTDYAALQARIAELEARNAASERDAMQAGLFRRFVAFAKGRRAPTWMPQRFLDECRDVIEEKA